MSRRTMCLEHIVDKKDGRSFIRIPRSKRDGKSLPAPAPTDARLPGQPPDAARNTNQDRERIVIPRQDRGEKRRSELDIELREVRRGVKPGNRYLRVVPGQRRFTRVDPGYIEATRLASRPPAGFDRALSMVKGVVLGSPFATAQAIHERLTKVKALSVLGSDPLSSSAYATEEALIILALAGTGALIYSLPISLVVAALMIVVVISYRQTQKAYPSGGGA